MPHPSFLCHCSVYHSGGVAFSCFFRSLPDIPFGVRQGVGAARGGRIALPCRAAGRWEPPAALISAESRLPAGQNCLSQLCPSYQFPPGKKMTENWLSKGKKLLLINSPALPAARPPAPGSDCGTGHGPPQFLTAPSPLGSCRSLPGSSHTPEDIGFVAASEAGRTELCQPPPAGRGKSWRDPKPSNTTPFLSFQTRTKAKEAAWN